MKKIIKNYYTFFDETLQSSTFIVLFISAIVFLVGLFVPAANANLYKGSVLDNGIHAPETRLNTVVIGGEEYELIFSKIK